MEEIARVMEDISVKRFSTLWLSSGIVSLLALVLIDGNSYTLAHAVQLNFNGEWLRSRSLYERPTPETPVEFVERSSEKLCFNL